MLSFSFFHQMRLEPLFVYGWIGPPPEEVKGPQYVPFEGPNHIRLLRAWIDQPTRWVMATFTPVDLTTLDSSDPLCYRVSRTAGG